MEGSINFKTIPLKCRRKMEIFERFFMYEKQKNPKPSNSWLGCASPWIKPSFHTLSIRKLVISPGTGSDCCWLLPAHLASRGNYSAIHQMDEWKAKISFTALMQHTVCRAIPFCLINETWDELEPTSSFGAAGLGEKTSTINPSENSIWRSCPFLIESKAQDT